MSLRFCLLPLRVFVISALASGCASLPPSSDVAGWLESKKLSAPDAESFPHCRGYGCRIVDHIHLSSQDWAEIEDSFVPRPRNPLQEREAVSSAIGVFERRVGAIAGTGDDVAGTFGRIGDFQQDCIDESTNSTVFLSLLDSRGLLSFHEVRTPAGRFPVLAGSFWPHHTAVIAEKGTGQAFAVDSWFEKGGEPAYVVPLEVWSAGWSPERL